MKKAILSGMILALLPLLGAQNNTAGRHRFIPASGGTPTITVTHAGSTYWTAGAGDLLVFMVYSGPATSLTCNLSGTASSLPLVGNGSTFNYIQIFYILTAVAGTELCSVVGPTDQYAVVEFHSTSGTWHFDTSPPSGGATGYGASANSGNMTTASTGGEVIFCLGNLDNIAATASNFQIGGNAAITVSGSPFYTYDSNYYLLNTPVTAGACTESYSPSTDWSLAGAAFHVY
jgi:hypothetical protein